MQKYGVSAFDDKKISIFSYSYFNFSSVQNTLIFTTHILILFIMTLVHANGRENAGKMETPEEVKARLRANVMREKNGDIYMEFEPYEFYGEPLKKINNKSTQVGYDEFAYLLYLDPKMDAKSFIEGLPKIERFSSWDTSRPIWIQGLESYFKDIGFKNVRFGWRDYFKEKIPIEDFQQSIKDGVPIYAKTYRLTDSLIATLKQRQIEREKYQNINDWILARKSLPIYKKAEESKELQYLANLCIVGYNVKSQEFLVVMRKVEAMGSRERRLSLEEQHESSKFWLNHSELQELCPWAVGFPIFEEYENFKANIIKEENGDVRIDVKACEYYNKELEGVDLKKLGDWGNTLAYLFYFNPSFDLKNFNRRHVGPNGYTTFILASLLNSETPQSVKFYDITYNNLNEFSDEKIYNSIDEGFPIYITMFKGSKSFYLDLEKRLALRKESKNINDWVGALENLELPQRATHVYKTVYVVGYNKQSKEFLVKFDTIKANAQELWLTNKELREAIDACFMDEEYLVGYLVGGVLRDGNTLRQIDPHVALIPIPTQFQNARLKKTETPSEFKARLKSNVMKDADDNVRIEIKSSTLRDYARAYPYCFVLPYLQYLNPNMDGISFTKDLPLGIDFYWIRSLGIHLKRLGFKGVKIEEIFTNPDKISDDAIQESIDEGIPVCAYLKRLGCVYITGYNKQRREFLILKNNSGGGMILRWKSPWNRSVLKEVWISSDEVKQLDTEISIISFSEHDDPKVTETPAEFKMRLKSNVIKGENGDVRMEMRPCSQADYARTSPYGSFTLIYFRYLDPNNFDAVPLVSSTTSRTGWFNDQLVAYLKDVGFKGVKVDMIDLNDRKKSFDSADIQRIHQSIDEGVPVFAYVSKINDTIIGDMEKRQQVRTESKDIHTWITTCKSLGVTSKSKKNETYQTEAYVAGYNKQSGEILIVIRVANAEGQFLTSKEVWLTHDELSEYMQRFNIILFSE